MSKITRWKKPLRLSNIDSMPRDKSGVYGFWCRTSGRCLYIGKAEDQSIRDRVKQHWDNCHNFKLRQRLKFCSHSLDICYIPVERGKIAKIDSLETKLIRMWNPETNVAKRRK